MILVDFQNTIFNFSNASIVDISKEEIAVYYNNDIVVNFKYCDTSIDTSSFGDYFFKFENEERKIYFNRYNFLYMQKREAGVVRFQFFENFTFDLMVDYDKLISQIE